MRRRAVLTTVVFALVALVASVFASAAGAETKISEPTGNPYHVALDAQGNPVPFTVVASGFAPQTPVYVEVCDSRKPDAPNWSPSRDCDPTTSQSPVYADARGNVRFDANDRNRALVVFSGASPQQLFNCLPPNASSPKNGIPDFKSCQVRVSSNPTQATQDQAFVPIVLGGDTAGSGGSSGNGSLVLVLVIAGAVIVGAVVLATRLARRRRVPQTR
jgi:hypothetical protein